MYYTFAQAKLQLARFADGGCDQVGQAINDAVDRLMSTKSWKCLSRIVRMCVVDQVFPMPQNVESITRAVVDGVPVSVFGSAYQFLSSGPGDLDYRVNATSGYNDVMDVAGFHPTMFDIPLDLDDGYSLVAFCTNPADAGKQIFVEGYGPKNEERKESLIINRWANGVEGAIHGEFGSGNHRSEHTYRTLGHVILPEGLVGYTSLYAVRLDTNEMRFLAKYHPRILVPDFRRYRLTQPLDLTNAASAAYVLAEVKLAFVPLVDDTDLLPFDSLAAVKLMMQSILKENAGALQEAVALSQLAEKALADKQVSKHDGQGLPNFIGFNYRLSLGARLNRRRL